MNFLNNLFNSDKDGKKNKLPQILILFLVGVILLIFPNTLIKDKQDVFPKASEIINGREITKTESSFNYDKELEKRLEYILAQIDGVGKVKVMITRKYSKEIFIDKISPYKESNMEEEDSNGGKRNSTDKEVNEETVMMNGAGGGTEPIILKEKEPVLQGIVILAEGGDDTLVREKLTRAAEALLDIPIYRIKVYKMK